MADLMTTIAHIWTVFVNSNTFNFVLFAIVFVWIFKKINIKGMLDSLHQKIVTTIETVKVNKEQALKRLEDVKKTVKNLPNEIKSVINDATTSAEVIEKKLLEDAQKQVESIKANAEKVIEAEEKMLKSVLTRNASKASVEVAKSHISKSLELNPALHEKYINESIDSLDRLNF